MSDDLVIIEASQNTFKIVERLETIAIKALVMETRLSGAIRKNYCNNDKISAVKIAKVYLSGIAGIVWKPDVKTRSRRELLQTYQYAVTASTRLKNRIRGFLNEHCIRLPRGFRLTSPEAAQRVLALREWDHMETLIIESSFEDLLAAEQRRKTYNKAIAREVMQDPQLLKLMRLMGVAHLVAFAIGAIVGNITRFSNQKKLVAYIGLNPSNQQSGKHSYRGGLLRHGRKDVRSLLVQSAQNAMPQKHSPLHKWGWRLFMKKSNKRIAVIAFARKLLVQIWYLMQGKYTNLKEPSQTLLTKIARVTTIIGKEEIIQMGYESKAQFQKDKIELIIQTT